MGERDDKFVFTVESTGVLSPEDIVSRALTILKEKLSTLAEAMKKHKYNSDYWFVIYLWATNIYSLVLIERVLLVF